ncbi:MAG: hypothetical protein ABFC24_10830 [Methanoregulaceae archaeon]
MTARAGLFGESKQFFDRYIEDCGVNCEVVTPQVVATPFYRGRFSALIIPTGFANPKYSNLLPALRASSPRLKRFVEAGGNLLVFGAGADRPDAYDWLPFLVTYSHGYADYCLEFPENSPNSAIASDYDHTCIPCDGFFPCHEATVLATAEGKAVLLERTIGNGTILVTSIHEYPSRGFVGKFCSSGSETLF